MREILVVAKCDRCKVPLDTDDEPAQSWTIMGFEYRIDLCDSCQKKVADFLDFLPKPENFRCDECERAFDTQQGLSMHRTRTHTKEFGHKGKPTLPPIVGDGVPCPECGERFGTRNAVNAHLQKHKNREAVA